MNDCPFLSFLDFKGFQFNAKVIPIESLGEIIAVIDDTVSAEYIDLLSNFEVFRLVVLLFG